MLPLRVYPRRQPVQVLGWLFTHEAQGKLHGGTQIVVPFVLVCKLKPEAQVRQPEGLQVLQPVLQSAH